MSFQSSQKNRKVAYLETCTFAQKKSIQKNITTIVTTIWATPPRMCHC